MATLNARKPVYGLVNVKDHFIQSVYGLCSMQIRAYLSSYLAIDNLNTTALIAGPVALDDRINRFDKAAPIAVYANSNDGVDIYTVTNGNGAFAFQVNDMSNAECGSTITSQDGIIVSRTSDCVYQVNAPQYNGKVYVLRFPEVSSTTAYTSVEE